MTEQPEALRLANALRDGTYLLSVERDVTEAVLREQHAEIERLRAERLPTPPPECATETERNAYAFGFWAGVAAARKEGDR